MPPLPYRTDAEALHRYVAGRSAGLSASGIRASGFATKQFEGTAAAVESLGLVTDREGALTPLGRRLAATDGPERAAVLAEVLRSYPPYATLLGSAAGAEPPVTLREVETRWEAGGYGTSDSNRAEAAPVFARLVEAAGMGRFVSGRRGRGSRIEWAQHEPDPAPASGGSPPGAAPGSPGAPEAAPVGVSAVGGAGESGTRLHWQLEAGRVVSLRLPGGLTRAERARVRALFDVLLQE